MNNQPAEPSGRPVKPQPAPAKAETTLGSGGRAARATNRETQDGETQHLVPSLSARCACSLTPIPLSLTTSTPCLPKTPDPQEEPPKLSVARISALQPIYDAHQLSVLRNSQGSSNIRTSGLQRNPLLVRSYGKAVHSNIAPAKRTQELIEKKGPAFRREAKITQDPKQPKVPIPMPAAHARPTLPIRGGGPGSGVFSGIYFYGMRASRPFALTYDSVWRHHS